MILPPSPPSPPRGCARLSCKNRTTDGAAYCSPDCELIGQAMARMPSGHRSTDMTVHADAVVHMAPAWLDARVKTAP